MAYWSCLQLEPNRVRLALHFLGLNGYSVYCPRMRVARRLNPDGSTPLFPGYAFLVIEAQWHAAQRSPGVIRLIMDGNCPSRVPDRAIADLRSRERDGLIELPPPPPSLRRGDPVRIVSGAFQGHAALYQGMRPRQRVEVLLALFASERRVELSRRDIVRAGVDGP